MLLSKERGARVRARIENAVDSWSFDAKAMLSYAILDANLLSRVSRSCSCRGNCGVSYQNRGFHVDKLDLESERVKS